MTGRKRNSLQFIGGLIVLGCALLMIILSIVAWSVSGEKLQLGVAAVFLCLGTVLLATSRRRSSIEKDKTG
jgi:uncharacterized membrane protein